jgi:RNA polymerase sigma-70 factor (ECF subfamily)
VLAAGQRQSPDRDSALAKLCEAYWYPLYAFARRRGASSVDASDLVQGFFATLLEKEYLDDADPSRGRFRTFLLTAFKRYILKQHDRAVAQKRGGGVRHLSLDYEAGESRYSVEPGHEMTPERVFERRWALTVLDNALTKLRQENESAAKTRQFDALKVLLTGESAPRYRDIADDLGMTEGAVKVAVHRLRQRFRELIRAEIAQTVADAAEIDEEVRSLQAALAND